MPESAMRDRILDAAEARARVGGYHGFSFRDVAADVGVKSASVHYHFPTKAALAQTLASRYADRALAAIGAPETPLAAFDQVASLFHNAIAVDERMCLCGLFEAERDGLPPEVASAVARFFSGLRAALDGATDSKAAPFRSETVLATLEGALLVARAAGDVAVFERVVDDLRSHYTAEG